MTGEVKGVTMKTSTAPTNYKKNKIKGRKKDENLNFSESNHFNSPLQPLPATPVLSHWDFRLFQVFPPLFSIRKHQAKMGRQQRGKHRKRGSGRAPDFPAVWIEAGI